MVELRYRGMIEERTRVAREMHDTLLQGFTGITMQLEHVRRRIASAPASAESTLGELIGQADVSLKSARRAVWEMRAPDREAGGLATGLESVLNRAVTGVKLEYSVRGRQRLLAPIVESTVFHIALEAAANATKHAHATTIAVTLEYTREGVTLTVRDDGSGFDVGHARRLGGDHFGLAGMAERAARIGAKLDIDSTPSHGTSVLLSGRDSAQYHDAVAE